MADLHEMFGVPKVTPEELENKAILVRVIKIIEDLAAEAIEDKREYSCDDIADILDHFVANKLDGGDVANVLLVFADVLRDAQHSMHRSIETQLALLIDSDITKKQRALFIGIKNEPQLYNWIKITSI